MAHCDDYIELISAAVDGTLTEAEAARLQSHLAQCADCRSLLRDLQDLHAALRSLPRAEPPADLTGRILAAVADDNVTPFPARRTAGWRRWAASAAVMALVLAGAWGLRGGSGALVDKAADGGQPVLAEGVDPESAEESLLLPAAPDPLPTQAGAVADLPPDGAGRMTQTTQGYAAPTGAPPVQGAAGRASKQSPVAVPEDALSQESAAALPTPEGDSESSGILPFRSTALLPNSLEGMAERADALPPADEVPQSAPKEDSGEEETGLVTSVAPALFSIIPLESGLTPRQGLERLIEEQGFTGYEWIEDGESVSVRPELSRTPAILWMNGTEGISYINYLGLSEDGDYHLYQFDHLEWDIVEFNSCPTGQVTHLTRYSVPVTGEGDILAESLEAEPAAPSGE